MCKLILYGSEQLLNQLRWNVRAGGIGQRYAACEAFMRPWFSPLPSNKRKTEGKMCDKLSCKLSVSTEDWVVGNLSSIPVKFE